MAAGTARVRDGPKDVAPEVLREVFQLLGGDLQDLRHTAPRRLTVRLPSDRVRRVLQTLRDELACRHLSAMSGFDAGPTLDVVYHLAARGGTVLSIRCSLPRDAPRIASVTDVFPAANLYEREIHDVLGITFEGHPDPRPLLLYEGWPEGEYPLRKDWKPSGEEGRHARG
jgi:NADH-quinone oxidoreductase subunit C